MHSISFLFLIVVFLIGQYLNMHLQLLVNVNFGAMIFLEIFSKIQIM